MKHELTQMAFDRDLPDRRRADEDVVERVLDHRPDAGIQVCAPLVPPNENMGVQQQVHSDWPVNRRSMSGDGASKSSAIYSTRIALAGVFVQIGLVPNTEWLKGSVELNRFGEIVVDAKGKTSVAGVFAAGDLRAVVGQSVPFRELPVALDAMERRQTVGRTVVRLS